MMGFSIYAGKVVEWEWALFIKDLDDQDESRSLVHSQTLARRQRTEIDWSGWNDYFVILLDHYRKSF